MHDHTPTAASRIQADRPWTTGEQRVRGTLSTASAAYRRFARAAAGAERERPTRLAGWSVGDLIGHVAWGAAMEAAAIRVAAGEPVSAAETDEADLDEAVADFVRAASLPVEPAVPVVLRAGTVPMGYAAPLFAFEAALHAADLADALTGAAPPLSPDELTACGAVVGPMLDLIASTAPDGVVIDIVSESDRIRLTGNEGTWHRGTPSERPATTTIEGSLHELVLFLCGRTGTTSLRVTGDRLHAERFKIYFPGP